MIKRATLEADMHLSKYLKAHTHTPTFGESAVESSVESANSISPILSADFSYQTCLIFDHRLSQSTGIVRQGLADSRRPIVCGPSGYGP